MGLVLRPAEIKSGAAQVRANIENTRESYSGALGVVQAFSQNEALKSESWDTAKSNIFEAHQAIVQGMSAAQDIISHDLTILESHAGDEDLDEDELVTTITRLTDECIRYEQMISTLMKMQAISMIAGGFGIAKMIVHYQKMLQVTRMMIGVFRQKLLSLQSKSAATQSLFLSVATLLQAVECAISDAEVFISGKGEMSNGEWKVVIKEEIEKLNNEDIFLESYLQNELGIVIDDFREIYGEETVNEIKSYMDGYEVHKLDDVQKQEINIFILEKTCDCDSVSIEDGQYQLKNDAGKVVYQFSENEFNEVVTNIAFANQDVKVEYIAGYLKTNLEISDMHIAAIMGNLYVESRYSPLISQKDSSDYYHPEYCEKYSNEVANGQEDGLGWGLAQWTDASRKKGLYDYAMAKGDISYFGDMDTQLEYLVWELEEGTCKNQFQKFLKKTDYEEATIYFMEYIEIPGVEHRSWRVGEAERLLNEYFVNEDER